MAKVVRYYSRETGAWRYPVPAELDQANIYEIVKWFATSDRPTLTERQADEVTDLALTDIINIHNLDGVTHVKTVQELTAKIKRGIEIADLETGISNIQLVRISGRLVAINGHHTLISYMYCGAKKLTDVPHLQIEDIATGEVTPAEFLVVFGHHASKIDPKHWQDLVLNWSAPEDRQLEPRVQRNMGELLAAFVKAFGDQL